MLFMIVIAHYLDKSFVSKTRPIALRRLYKSYLDENMAKMLILII